MINQAAGHTSLADALIWDAVDHDVSVIHLQPDEGGYAIRYRAEGELDILLQLSSIAFSALDRQLTSRSTPVRTENKRRLFLDRKTSAGVESLQVRYQKLETFSGERLTLNIIPQSRMPRSVDDITDSPEEAATLRRWSQAPKGLVLVSGRSGSGKTTTSFVCLEEVARPRDRVIFTIEESVEFLLPNVEQVEVDLNDTRACRDAFDAVFASDLDVLFVTSSLSSDHQKSLCRHALSAAESGHLVFVQLDAVSPEDARQIFETAVERDIEDQLVGITWQELSRDAETGRRSAHYEFVPGPLGVEQG
ncbi:MAG: ATPase, T2SS/T4P/T4SS family [Myxococcota bacterium]|nr:ATPase, T2SS/T4P/T4SS family [Myxococcota bacterium]